VAGVVIGVLGLGLAGLLAAPRLRATRHDVSVARGALERARLAVAGRDVAGATAALDQADAAIARAGRRAHGFPLNVVAPFPVVGSPVKALSAGVRAGREVVAAGRILTGAVGSFPTSGRSGVEGHDLSGIHAVSVRSTDALANAGAHLMAAHRDLTGPAGAALPQVSGPTRDLLVTVDGIRRQLSSAEGGLRLLSGLTDPAVDVRLLLLSQDSMELRATGGFIGSFGVVHLARGTLTLERYQDVGTLPAPLPAAEAPEGLAGALPGPWDLSNSNWWPDFPTSARAAMALYARQGGGNVDGVIAVTEAVMGRLVGVVGSVILPGYAKPVVEAGFARRALYEVELKPVLDTPRKKFLIELASEVFHRLFSLPPEKLPAVLEAFAQAAATGDLQVYFSDPAWQAAIAGQPIEGALPRPAGDFLALVDSNLTGGKANADLVRTVNYTVQATADGRPRATLDIEYSNNGAASVTNPYYNGYLRVYVPNGSTLSEASQAAATSFGPAPDGSYDVIAAQVYVDPLGKQTVHFEYQLPKQVTAGAYQLTWLRQPGTPADTLTATVGTQTFHADPAHRKLQITALL